MSDNELSNGEAKTGKRKIANTTISGGVASIQFSAAFGNKLVEVDTRKLPEVVRDNAAAYGVSAIVQSAYNLSDDPVGAAEAAVKRLQSGEWSPGLPRREAEPDVLTAALMRHLSKDAQHVETHFYPAYAAKHDLEVGAAKRKLRAHPDIATLIAEITAERAKRVSAAVRKAPRESLDV